MPLLSRAGSTQSLLRHRVSGPVEVPELGAWLCNEESRAFTYEKDWEEASSRPWLILHTSGTTGQMLLSRALGGLHDAERAFQAHHVRLCI